MHFINSFGMTKVNKMTTNNRMLMMLWILIAIYFCVLLLSNVRVFLCYSNYLKKKAIPWALHAFQEMRILKIQFLGK